MPYAMFHTQIYVLTCLYVQIYMLQPLCHVFLCFAPLFVLGRRQGYMLTCLYDVVGYALLGYMCFMCLFPCYVVRSLSSHAFMLGFMFFHVYVLSFYMSTCMFLCLYDQIYFFTCLCTWIYVLYMLYTIFHVLVCSMPCLCAQTQAMFVMPCAIVALLSFCLSFLCFGLLVWTRSRPYGLCHFPYTLAHIKGFGSSLFACLCLLASTLYACVSLSCSRLFHA